MPEIDAVNQALRGLESKIVQYVGDWHSEKVYEAGERIASGRPLIKIDLGLSDAEWTLVAWALSRTADSRRGVSR